MKNMKTIILPLLILIVLFSDCRDKYSEEYLSLEPVYLSYKSLREAIKTEASRDLVKPGKIYFYSNYFFINEYMKGVHVFDNSNPASPKAIGFINIPGNVDIVVKDKIMYADSYIDLVAVDVTNPATVKEVGRVKSVFQYAVPTYDSNIRVGTIDDTKGVVVDWEEKVVRKEIENSNYLPYPIQYRGKTDTRVEAMNDVAAGSKGESSSSGVGGSMARFGLIGSSLVSVDNSTYYYFDISNPTTPSIAAKTALGWAIETMFLVGKTMFLGTRNGMLVYDISTVSKPVYLSTFWHATGCDPVVVQNNRAYVTIRGGNPCGSNINRLDVLDVTNLLKPVLLRSYTMTEPYGLGIDDDLLFVCDGKAGLKVYNATDPNLITENFIAGFPEIQAYDVIPLGSSLLMIGNDGFYQYDYSNLKNIKLISSIKIKGDATTRK